MRGDGSLGYWFRKTSHSYTWHRKYDDESSTKECIEVSLGEEGCEHRSLETRHYSSCNHGGCESCGKRSQHNIQYTSINCGGCERRSNLTSQFSLVIAEDTLIQVDLGLIPATIPTITKMNVHQTSHYYSHNQGECITYIHLLWFIFSTTHTRKGHESKIRLSGRIYHSFYHQQNLKADVQKV